jgi:hypothetical protein
MTSRETELETKKFLSKNLHDNEGRIEITISFL